MPTTFVTEFARSAYN